MNYLARLTSIAILGSMILATTTLAMAQSSQQDQALPSTQQRQSFSQQTLQKYVHARTDMTAIRQNFSNKVQQTSSKSEMIALRQQASQGLIKAIKDNGLTVQKFREIKRAVRSNPELARKVQQIR